MVPADVSQRDISLCLERVLSSTTFANAGRLREFLRFTSEQALAGKSNSLKEVVIGIAVFERKPGYDPKSDNIVRTAARRVRAKLDEYYATEGNTDPIRIELPKGTYVPVFLPARVSDAPSTATPDSDVPAIGRFSPHRTLWLLIAVCAAAALAVVFIFIPTHHAADKPWRMVPFSSAPGYERYAAMSPDGRAVAFAWDGNGDARQIYVQMIGSSSPRQLLKDTKEDIRPAWSPDGKRIAYVQLTEPGQHDVYISSSDGSQRRKLTTLVSYEYWMCNEPHLDWSPDGSELVSVEQGNANSSCRVVAVDTASGAKRFLTQPETGVMADAEPAFSPDGKTIAFLRQTSPEVGDVFVMPRRGRGPPRRTTFEESKIRGFSWTADGKALICSTHHGASFLNLWRFPVSGGAPARLTESPLDLGFPSAARTDGRIAYVSDRDDANIWRYRAGANEQLIASVSADVSPAYSPDGLKIAFVSNRTGNPELWLAGADGKSHVQLTTFRRFAVGSPFWSPDSRQIAFDVGMPGHSEVYIVDAVAGRPARRLIVNGLATAAVPSWSSNGQFLYFGSRPTGIWNVYRVPVSGGNPAQITADGGLRAFESPDGKYLYFKKTKTGIWRLPLGSTSPEEPVSAAVQGPNWASWCLGRAGLYFLPAHRPQDYGPVPIELLRPGSETPEPVGRTDKAPLAGDSLAMSTDGASFLYSQLDQRGSNIMLLEQ